MDIRSVNCQKFESIWIFKTSLKLNWLTPVPIRRGGGGGKVTFKTNLIRGNLSLSRYFTVVIGLPGWSRSIRWEMLSFYNNLRKKKITISGERYFWDGNSTITSSSILMYWGQTCISSWNHQNDCAPGHLNVQSHYKDLGHAPTW